MAAYESLPKKTRPMKLVVLILLLAIVASLGYGLFFLSKDDKGSVRLLNALKVRVALSALLIIFLVLSYLMGWMPSRSAP